jgi:hypothetical protein
LGMVCRVAFFSLHWAQPRPELVQSGMEGQSEGEGRPLGGLAVENPDPPTPSYFYRLLWQTAKRGDGQKRKWPKGKENLCPVGKSA